MPDVFWPPQLQQLLNVAEFSVQIGSTTIRSENDIGPAKVRRRSTKSVDRYNCSINIDMSEYQIVYDFFDIDLNGGVRQFVFPHPITQVNTYFRMVEPPSFRPLGGRTFQVSMIWEATP